MRIWDVDVRHLCRRHLLSEHRELHGLWNVLTVHGGKGGYSHHPETLRWVGKLKALYLRHEQEVREMKRRGYKHQSPLDVNVTAGGDKQTFYLDSPDKQISILRGKTCGCFSDNLSK